MLTKSTDRRIKGRLQGNLYPLTKSTELFGIDVAQNGALAVAPASPEGGHSLKSIAGNGACYPVPNVVP